MKSLHQQADCSKC